MIGIDLGVTRSGAAQWWPSGASFAVDFTRDRYMRGGANITAGEAFSFLRASAKYADTLAAEWASFAPNIPAITNKGLLIEGPETYYPTNSVLDGMTLGNVGAGGSLANGWGYAIGGGGTLTIDAITTIGGQPAFVATWAITNSTGGSIYPNILFAQPSAAQGETWTGAVWYDVINNAGDSGIDSNLVIQEREAGSFLGGTTIALAAGGRQSTSRTLTQANVDTTWFLISHILADGQSLNRTITISLPTLTKSGNLSSPMVTTESGALVREEDAMTLHLPTGPHELSLVFDDGSEQVISAVTDDDYLLPTNLDREHIRSLACF